MKALLDTSLHRLLALANPDSRVVLLLVGLIGALGVADLGLEVIDVLGDIVTAGPVSKFVMSQCTWVLTECQ